MKKGSSGLILLILISLVVLIILFVSTKFVLPNPETVKENKKNQENAQETINKYQQKSTQEQIQEVK